MLHLYIGDGKGKTTAALGLALRAAGCGKKVYIAQFLKDKGFFCGEIEAIKKSKLNIIIERFNHQTHPIFLKNKQSFNLNKIRETTKIALRKIYKYLIHKKIDVIVLDEILNSLAAGFISIKALNNFLKHAENIEVIFTGRRAPAPIINKADYISFIKKIKHPFDKKIPARKSIEY